MKKNNISMNDDSKEIVRFCIILGVIILIVLIIYLISNSIANRNVYHYDEPYSATFNYENVMIGTMFNRPEEEYYVILYKKDNPNAEFYKVLASDYATSENALKIYYCDISDKMNEKYYASDGKSNPNAKTIDDLKVGDLTLVKIKKGKITKYLEKFVELKEELKP